MPASAKMSARLKARTPRSGVARRGFGTSMPFHAAERLVPRSPAARRPAAGATSANGMRVTKSRTTNNPTEKRANRATARDRPTAAWDAGLHEQVRGGKRQRHAEHDPDPSHDHDGTGAGNVPTGTMVDVKRALEGGFVLDDDRRRIDRAAVHAFLSTSYWAAGRERR